MSDFRHPNRRQVIAGLSCLPLLGCASGEPMRSKAEGDFITIEGRDLHYVKAGNGPPILLLHGASGNLRDWTFSRFDELSRNYTVLAFDRPGLGLSDAAEDASLSAQARLMRTAAAELGMANATIVGQSFGGSVALAWAIDAPESVNGLVLVASPSQVWPGSAGRMYDIANIPLVGYAFSNLVPILASERRIKSGVATIFAPQPVPDGYLAHIQPELATRPQIFRNNTAQVGALKEQIRKMVPEYQKLTMPIELIHGTSDTIVPIDVHSAPFARTVSRARLTTLEGVGHMPHQTSPDVLFAAIARAV